MNEPDYSPPVAPKIVKASDRQYAIGPDGARRRITSKEEQRELRRAERKFRKYEQLIHALGSLAYARALAIENPAGPEAEVFAKYKITIEDLRRLESPEALIEEMLKRL
jgi:hypothetical protein